MFGGNDNQYPFRNTDQGPNAPLITQKASISPSDVHVLVVDDEHISRTLVSSLLRRCNYTGKVPEATYTVTRASG